MAEPEPESSCKCHRSFASVSPMHLGHCCFFPASQTCHPLEVAAWQVQKALRLRRTSSASSSKGVS